ncbi:MAG TPA: LysM peptidoglycan-binding domain-containing protein [Steroidobacteraceae bacterium]|nr:LysM peptidoglycan-binding domain-containing protein [Steroidobacteraceae bacterium]
MSHAWLRGLALAAMLALAAPRGVLGAPDAFPRPPELEPAVHFWVRVYTEIDTDSGFLHDDENLSVVYETVHFAPNTSPRERERVVDDARDRYVAALKRIARASGPLAADDQRIRDLWGEEGTPARLLEATDHVRFQLGQSDRFRAGLERSGQWEKHIAETLANLGLPAELAVLPHVESSFNPAAHSKAGAAGLWQFMRSTGRRFMRIDSTVDDRMDPFHSTEAAAQLLSYNYRLLGTWPLALTAYNHGAAGVRRAVETLGTDDIATIVRDYKSPSFGFASRNFYASFLAALEVDKDPEKYFGPIHRLPEARFQEVALPTRASIGTLVRALRIDLDTLHELNPALRRACWRGQRPVPKGYRLRLPIGDAQWTSELVAQRLGLPEAGPSLASDVDSSRHRVERGETLASLAEQYGVSARTLARMNGLRASARLRPGREIRVPGEAAVVQVASRAEVGTAPTATATPAVAAGPLAATATSAVAAGPAASPPAAETDIYVVERGDSLGDIAGKVGVSESQLLALNHLRDPNFIFEGQHLALAETVAAGAGTGSGTASGSGTAGADTEAVGAVSSASPGDTGTGAGGSAPQDSGGVPAEVAELESEEDAEALVSVVKPAAQSQPVSAAQQDALGPALGPAAVEATATADPTDYSIAKDDTIVVAAAETIGHYADWLGVSAASLRTVNHMRYGRPVVIGHRVKLDFRHASREDFATKRREYHRALEATYFAAHRIAGTEVYIARRGDSLWNLTLRYEHLPIWLLQQYNPDVDFSDMRPGTQIVVPRVEDVSAGS